MALSRSIVINGSATVYPTEKVEDAMIQQFRVREMSKKDVDRIIEIMKQSFVEEFEIQGFNEESLRKQTRLLWLMQLMQKITGKVSYRIYVGDIKNTVVTSVTMNKSGKIWHIDGVMTAPKHRRQGFAEKLLMKAYDDAREYGGDRMILDVRKGNIPAEKLYIKLGFQEFEETIYFYKDTAVQQRELPMPQDYTLMRISVFDSKVLGLVHACREPETAKIYGETTFPPRFLRVLLKVFKPIKIERFAIKKEGEWIGIYTLVFTSTKEAARASIRLLKPHRGKGIEETLLTKALKRTYELGAPRVITSFDRKNRQFEDACRKLCFTETIVMKGMYKEL